MRKGGEKRENKLASLTSANEDSQKLIAAHYFNSLISDERSKHDSMNINQDAFIGISMKFN